MTSTMPAKPDIVKRLRELGNVFNGWFTGATVREAAAEIERLYERLEMTHAFRLIDGKMTRVPVEAGSIPDGIECRDETIRLQDAHIKELIERLRAGGQT